jgi:hypothetical protein
MMTPTTTNTLHLDPRIAVELHSLAVAHNLTFDEMGNLALWQLLNPDGRPIAERKPIAISTPPDTATIRQRQCQSANARRGD